LTIVFTQWGLLTVYSALIGQMMQSVVIGLSAPIAQMTQSVVIGLL